MLKGICHSGEGQNLGKLVKPLYQIPTFVGMTILLLSLPAQAEDKNLFDILEESTAKPAETYSPEFCDFEITFPEKPVLSRRCPDGGAECYQLHGYRYVFDMESSIDVSAHCAPSSPENYARYDEDVIKAALKGMRTRANIDNAEINAMEIEGEKTRQGSLLGTGKYGTQDSIYNAQIWVGENSILTVEAKLIGGGNETADEAFSDILKSIQVKD